METNQIYSDFADYQSKSAVKKILIKSFWLYEWFVLVGGQKILVCLYQNSSLIWFSAVAIFAVDFDKAIIKLYRCFAIRRFGIL